MNFVVANDKATYPLQPEHINAFEHFWNAFNHAETEISATLIVCFLQQRGQGWAPFTKEEIDEFYHQRWPGEPFYFNKLLSDKDEPKQENDWIVYRGGKYYVTHQFVIRCFGSSPKAN